MVKSYILICLTILCFSVPAYAEMSVTYAPKTVNDPVADARKTCLNECGSQIIQTEMRKQQAINAEKARQTGTIPSYDGLSAMSGMQASGVVNKMKQCEKRCNREIKY